MKFTHKYDSFRGSIHSFFDPQLGVKDFHTTPHITLKTGERGPLVVKPDTLWFLELGRKKPAPSRHQVNHPGWQWKNFSIRLLR